MDNKPPMSELSPYPPAAAVILAAGRGSRSGYALPKQYVEIGGEPVLRRTIRAFQASPAIGTIQVVIHLEDEALYRSAIKGLDALPPPVGGDETRQLSVLRGLEALQAFSPRTVMIHDGARPFVSCSLIERVAAAVEPQIGAVPAMPVSDTLRRSDGELLTETVSRDGLYAMQTPQAFAYDAILATHRQAQALGRNDMTDDAALFQLAGHKVRNVPGERGNIKLTQPDDFAYAELVMSAENEIRTGQGFDVHAFEAGDGVVLCGVPIAFERKLKGHSDADVGLHALTDAIFGAMADGDIGSHFPPSDPQWKGMASDHFLKHAMKRLANRGGRLVSADVTLVCEKPKIGPHRDAMRERIAEICDVAVSRIAVKATTSEQLGFTGRGEGIAAMAVATIRLPAVE
jgi:2-C-methyl-D-erythritol 4-phosphate cytidylyltransferase/2-C-methyl-D-erythritol 2,4-cyclodiphosphate synthase